MRLPNLFMIGAMKSGTTTLADHLVKSSDIEAFAGKEPQLFNQTDRAGVERRLKAEWRSDRTTKYVLDATPNYSRRLDDRCAELIKTMTSEPPRFIYMVRDPVGRTVSHYFWARQLFGESLSFRDAIQRDPQYTEPGLYHLQIAKFLEHFEPDRFIFIKFEDFIKDPVAAAEDVIARLHASQPEALAPSTQLAFTDKNVTRDARFPVLMQAVRANRGLKGLIKRVLPPLYLRAALKSITKEVPRFEISAEDKRFVYETYFSSVAEETEKLTGLDLQSWTRNGADPDKVGPSAA